MAYGLGTDLNSQQISRNLVAFHRAGPAVRTLLKANVLQIVELIARRTIFDLTANGAIALAKLIELGAELDRQTFVKTCATILPFAMTARREPASKVIVTAFPTVYEELRKGREDSGLFKFFMFIDWDRCKVARKDLVRAFMTSEVATC